MLKCPKCDHVGQGGYFCEKCKTYIPLSDEQIKWMLEHEKEDSIWWISLKGKVNRRKNHTEGDINRAFGKFARASNNRLQLLREIEYLKSQLKKGI